MDTLANLQKKLSSAEDLKSVVRTMKAMAASNIGQYELAVSSLGEYNRTVGLGILGYFREKPTVVLSNKAIVESKKERLHCAVVFGSDQGLVGQFNDIIAEFVADYLAELPGKTEIWVVGERLASKLLDMGYPPTKRFVLPGAVEAITPLVSQILVKSEENIDNGRFEGIYVFHNQPKNGVGYSQMVEQLLPLNEQWKQRFLNLKWPTNFIPQVAGGMKDTLLALIHEYLFSSLFKACAESLASENSSRLIAMQRAEKNIGELLDNLNYEYHQLRQGLIDAELFDVIAGFEALKKKR
ncbi:F0F1 ATP synthase subunit gamma [Cyclobacterium sp. SYSU L10401]|uniref:F0F1 ATP synthase subunit gamma n=1 Tax=Cyclobacterium sp. SYSU L10401 TaxID=2678657 RepID=UPI0013D089F0|nr:F0F1 ATP synthase subunit gamma [Cyclobacterium sp. SYSU L10401]